MKHLVYLSCGRLESRSVCELRPTGLFSIIKLCPLSLLLTIKKNTNTQTHKKFIFTGLDDGFVQEVVILEPRFFIFFLR